MKENRQPRAYLAQLEGFRARANWAQNNSFEIFPVFAAAVIAAHVTSVDSETITNLALAFIVLRLAYVVVYIADQATMRSIIWFAGLGCCVYLLVLAGMQ